MIRATGLNTATAHQTRNRSLFVFVFCGGGCGVTDKLTENSRHAMREVILVH